MGLARSYLYVPGNVPDRFPKALATDADAVILDLEDAVPWPDKQAAREEVGRWLAGQTREAKELWVRVNSGVERDVDLAALLGITSLTGLVLAKTQSAADVDTVARQLAGQGHADRWLSPLLETPAAILDAREIAGRPRVQRLQIGEYDLCAEAGLSPTEDALELLPARMQVVFASAAAGIAPPVAPVSSEIKDAQRFARSTEAAARQGFVGRACIHPVQLGVVHAVFTPDEWAADGARQLLLAYEEHQRAGRGAFVDGNGRMIDEAVVRQARRTLDLAGG